LFLVRDCRENAGSVELKKSPIWIAALLTVLWLSGFVAEALAGPGMRHGLRHRMHQHDMHHSEGFIGSGFCPQIRATAHAPDEVYNLHNPLPANAENITAGEALFRGSQPTACKICHGVTGNGLGMMAQGLQPPPRNFACKETMQTLPDGQLFWIIKNGSPGTGMLRYQELSDAEVWQLVLYIRRFVE
jgi:mono/diheme cytochrome c family protein